MVKKLNQRHKKEKAITIHKCFCNPNRYNVIIKITKGSSIGTPKPSTYFNRLGVFGGLAAYLSLRLRS